MLSTGRLRVTTWLPGDYVDLGLATEIAGALVGWHREHPDPRLIPELCAYAFAENGASRRVLEKVGFTLAEEVQRAGVPQARYELT
ncbi:MAG TPA: GNAT family N-acetyltransferase [Pseudonocardia sp.]|nr:GNAT family N-acetyltransferase [Pseudonocardia sp.]